MVSCTICPRTYLICYKLKQINYSTLELNGGKAEYSDYKDRKPEK